ncbi:MAG: DUF3472 domain-containing protein [Pirellulaceae bacterium]
MLKGFISVAVAAICFFAHSRANAQHLWWDTKKLDDATCLYGEITVLATHEAIYYCGANWHPGEPAGGYCGIQHNSPKERRTIFSIWDTSADLHPKTTEADPKTIFNRFGGEGEGAHTHMLWNWQVGDTFQFFVRKEPGTDPGTTQARYFIYDRDTKAWRHSATIVCPNGDKKSEKSVATLGGGGLGSFLENFSGKDREVAKLALYRLWLGSSADKLTCLTQAKGDGTWGQLHDTYFLAEGSEENLKTMFAGLGKTYGKPALGEKGKRIDPISDKPVPPKVIEALKNLPHANKVEDK